MVPIIAFCRNAYKERERTNTLTRFFLYGDVIERRSFLATLGSSNTAVGAVIFIITFYGYLYGIGCIPWVILLWVTTQHTSQFVLNKAGGFIEAGGTLHEFLGARFQSNRVRIIAAILSTFAYIGLVSAEVVIGIGIFDSVLPAFPYDFGPVGFSTNILPVILIILVTFLVSAYCSLAGYRAVIKTDWWQFLQVLLMLAVVWIFIGTHLEALFASYNNYFPDLYSVDAYLNGDGQGIVPFILFFVIMNVLFWGGWWPAAMDQWQRCAATRDRMVALNKTSGTAGWLSTVYFAVLSITFVIVGAMVRVLYSPNALDSQPLFTFLRNLTSEWSSATFSLSWVLIGLVASGLIAAFVSTTDTYLVTSAQSIISDIVVARKHGGTVVDIDNNPTLREKYLRYSRRTVILMPFIIIMGSLLIQSLADLFTVIYGFFAVMFAVIPPIALIVFGRSTEGRERAAFWSILTGGLFAVAVVTYLVVQIEAAYRGDSSHSLTFWYNWLYLASPMTALVGYVVYVLIPTSRPTSGSTNA